MPTQARCLAAAMTSKFPPGLLNPGASSAAAGAAAAGWCSRVLGVECPTRRDLIFNLFFTSYGVWMLLPLSALLLVVYRLVGPPEVCVLCGCVFWCVHVLPAAAAEKVSGMLLGTQHLPRDVLPRKTPKVRCARAAPHLKQHHISGYCCPRCRTYLTQLFLLLPESST